MTKLLGVLLMATAATSLRPRVGLHSCGLGSEVDNREWLERILGGLILEFLLVLGPGGTFEEEAVDTDTFLRDGECLLNTARFVKDDFLLDFSLWLDGIKGPLLFRVLSGDLLHSSSQETLRVIEAGEPERDGALTLLEPVVKLVVPVDEALDPTTERRGEPRDLGTSLELPLDGNTQVIDHVDGVDEVSSHDNGTIDGSDHIVHGLADDSQDSLELLNFLAEEVGERHVLSGVKTTRNLHHGELFLVVLLDEVRR